MVNDRNLALKVTKAEGKMVEYKKGEGSMGKTQEGMDKGLLRKTDFPMKHVTIPIKGNYQKSEPPIKCLLDVEFRSRLDKGLCFKCNDKYSLGHRCRVKEKRELMLFIMNEEESNEEECVTEENTEAVLELNHLNLTEGNEIELKTINGLTSMGTMKLKGDIRGREVVVLIDSGATHNFVHYKIVEEMKIPIETNTSFAVTIGDETCCRGRGLCKRLEVKL